ncbi:MAG: M28 family peptidase [Ignavibacteria bacterium]|nr:M28 family peptidase [Ignavibacteria bacterium]
MILGVQTRSRRRPQINFITRSTVVALLALLMGTVHAPLWSQHSTPFSRDSAASYLRVLAVDIGPRPMGSTAERRAMEFALDKFRTFGLNEAYILPMRVTPGGIGALPTNTASGTAVGVLRGRSDRTIVIGAHIDTDNPDIPGANDNGSGSAVVIELARLLSQRANESTIVFALFGGEERGLQGSRHFVANYRGIETVELMIQIDMANGSEWLLPLIDAGSMSSPEWLVRAAYEELEALGHTGLSYPTHFLALMSAAPGGGIGSDHIPFLERGIPAIDFTSDINDPIHTSQDTFENFSLDGLKRSGDLVYRLVERFDQGVPAESSSRYYLVQLGAILMFVPLWALGVAILVSLGFGIVALVWMRRHRVPETDRRKIPGLKLFLVTVIIVTMTWSSSYVVGLIKGDRYPWFAEPGGYFVLGLVAALGGVWISLFLVRWLGIARDAYRHFLRSVVFLFVFTILFLAVSVKLAIYPAVGIVMLSLAVLVRRAWLKFVLWLLAPLMMTRLVFSEGFELMTRAFALSSSGTIIGDVIVSGSAILLFSVLTFPFVTAFAALHFQSPEFFEQFRWIKSKRTGIGIAVALLFATIYLSLQPSYSTIRTQRVRIEQQYDQNTEKGFVEITSPDYLDGAVVTWRGRDTVIAHRTRRFRVGTIDALDVPWIRLSDAYAISDSSRFEGTTTAAFRHPPYMLEFTYRSPDGSIRNISPYVSYERSGRVTLAWESSIGTVLVLPMAFTIETGNHVQETVHATFTEEIEPVGVNLGHSSISRRTRITTLRDLGHF